VCGTYQLQRHVAINVLNKAFLTTMSLQLNYMLYGTCTVGNSAFLILDENYYKIKDFPCYSQVLVLVMTEKRR
jgi:hypothetical protein